MRCISRGAVLLGVLLVAVPGESRACCGGPADILAAQATPPASEVEPHPSAGGKYSGLLLTIDSPADAQNHGKYKDFGYWSNADSGGTTSGYWVYAAPTWYVWQNVVDTTAAQSTEQDPMTEATVGGKYSRLLTKIEVADDAQAYGRFYDFGFWQGQSWKGHTDLPPGHWVYLAPHWYIWGDLAPGYYAPPAGTPHSSPHIIWPEGASPQAPDFFEGSLPTSGSLKPGCQEPSGIERLKGC